MSENLILARKTLLEPSGLSDNEIEGVLSKILGHKVDQADLYFQNLKQESWTIEDSIIKEGGYSIEHGVGVRAISGDKTGFAYSDDILLPTLEESAKAARVIALRGGSSSVQTWSSENVPILYHQDNPLVTTSDSDKIELLKQIDKYARAKDNRVTQVIASLSGQHETILIASNDGTLNGDVRPLIRLSVSVIVEKDGVIEKGSYGGGGRMQYDYFITDDLWKFYVDEAVRLAFIRLEAKPTPAGNMPVVLGGGWPGVLLHEAVGHGLEGDFNRKGSSAFTGKIGQRVASELCTVVDDGTIEKRRGSLNIDDEGVQTKRNVLIENGILKGYMQDKLNAKLMGVPTTGNGRRESYAHIPMPRMTNTFMLAGKHDPQEIIASVEKGIYAVNFGGGQVDITSGKFVFSASEAYLIEKGKITSPVRDATLIGNGPETMTKISMVGNDLKLDSGIGTCGKDGQSVPVGVGQPTLLVDSMTVGGTD